MCVLVEVCCACVRVCAHVCAIWFVFACGWPHPASPSAHDRATASLEFKHCAFWFKSAFFKWRAANNVNCANHKWLSSRHAGLHRATRRQGQQRKANLHRPRGPGSSDARASPSRLCRQVHDFCFQLFSMLSNLKLHSHPILITLTHPLTHPKQKSNLQVEPLARLKSEPQA